MGEEKARDRLEQIGITFLSGYHAAREETGFVPLARRLTTVEADLRGFAFEGAAMGLALLDCFTPWRNDRWRTFTERLAEPHIYMMHVGLGWALARLRRSITSHLARLDPLLCWLVVDGYGFHEGYFGWPRYIERRAILSSLDGYERRVFDQGLGRSIWFVKGADVAAVARAIGAFSQARRADLWSGAGLACAYAGGGGPAAIKSLLAAAQGYLPALAQGVAFAAKTRQRAANLNAHTETVCLCSVGTPPKRLLQSPTPPFQTCTKRARCQLTKCGGAAFRTNSHRGSQEHDDQRGRIPAPGRKADGDSSRTRCLRFRAHT